MPSSGGPARQITAHPAVDWYPVWSPDGQEIAFNADRDGGGVWIVPASGGDARRLTTGSDVAAWSPDGQWLAIRRGTDLYRMPISGGEPTSLGPGYTPRFSTDGRWLYYSQHTGSWEKQGVWARSVADGTVVRLAMVEGRRGRLGGEFTVGADVLYFTWNEPDGDIWVMDATEPR